MRNQVSSLFHKDAQINFTVSPSGVTGPLSYMYYVFASPIFFLLNLTRKDCDNKIAVLLISMGVFMSIHGKLWEWK